MQFPGLLLFEKLATRERATSTSAASASGHSPDPVCFNWHLRRADDRRARQLGTGRTSTRRSTTGCFDEASRLTGRRALPRLRRAGRAALAGCRARDAHSRTSTRIDVRLRPNRLRRRQPVPRPDRGLPQVTRALAATLFAALVLFPAAGHARDQGGRHVPHRRRHRRRRPDRPCARFPDTSLLGDAAAADSSAIPTSASRQGSRWHRARRGRAGRLRDGKTYTFTIRKDARFSDGKPVTARAFAHALERILTPAMEHRWRWVSRTSWGRRRCSTARRRRSPAPSPRAGR